MKEYKIDYVFLYVDSSDKYWFNEYNKYYTGEYKNDKLNGLLRQDSFGLLKYKLRSIEQNMPWINSIYMVVMQESQIPDWLDTTKVNIIYHKDIIPNEFLPVFNTFAISLFIHNIPGLSEQFIFGCDDYYITTPTTPDMFFKNNTPIINLIKSNSDKGVVNSVTSAAYKNTFNLLFNDNDSVNSLIDDLSGNYMYKCTHHVKPMLKTVNKYVMEKYKADIYKSITKFRNGKNILFAIYHYWYVKTNNFVRKKLKTKMLILSKTNVDDVINWINKDDILISLDFSTYDKTIISKIECELNKKFPNKSLYEKV